MIEAEVNRFDFEQQIFDCWHVTKDLDAMYKHACESIRSTQMRLLTSSLG
jgi:hypothetical protein